MAQFVRIPTTSIEAFEIGIQQVSQIVYHLERVIEVSWQASTNRILVQDNGEWFYLHSPDIPQLTLKQVIEGLGYGNDQIVVSWALDDLQNEVLSLTVQNAPLNQLALYAAGVPLPNEPPQGHFPMVASALTVGTIPLGNEPLEPLNQLTILISN